MDVDPGPLRKAPHVPSSEAAREVRNETRQPALVVQQPADIGKHEPNLVLQLRDLRQDARATRLADPEPLEVEQHRRQLARDAIVELAGNVLRRRP